MSKQKISIDSHLLLNDVQKSALNRLLTNEEITIISWTSEQQDEANQFLWSHMLSDFNANLTNSTNSKWVIRNKYNDNSNIRKILYQCSCGIFNQNSKAKNTEESGQNFEFLECLSFAEITINKSTNLYEKVIGYFEHVNGCVQSNKTIQQVVKPLVIITTPPSQETPSLVTSPVKSHVSGSLILQLHPMIKEITSDLLKSYVPIKWVLKDNQKFVYNRCNGMVILDNSRLLVNHSDISNIMNEIPKVKLNINMRQPIESSLLELFFLKGDSNSLIRNSCFHYQPRTQENDRLEIGLSTLEQRDLAWTYGHQKLLIMDGTFTICDNRILLFALFVLDKDIRSIPVAYFLFSLPNSKKSVDGGYEYRILNTLFQKFIDVLGEKNSAKFFPKVVMTDINYREQQSVHQVWPGAAVIYNFFHVNKEWNKILKQFLGANGSQQIVSYRKEMKSYIRSVIQQISTMNETNHIKATVINAQKGLKSQFDGAYKTNSSCQILSILEGGIKFFQYLLNNWCNLTILGWSQAGRTNAAKILNIDVSSIPTTNNYIELIDNHLNNESLRQLQRRGTQLRVDVLVMYLVECVTPNFMKRHKFQKQLEENLKSLNGQNYVDQRYVELLKANYKHSVYMETDKKRESEAQKIASSFWGIVKYDYTDKLNVWVRPDKQSDIVYVACIYPTTEVSCQCIDFLSQGHTCKHIRASILYMNSVQMENIPFVTLPSREVAELALDIEADDDNWIFSDETEEDSSEDGIEDPLKIDNNKPKVVQNFPTILPNLKETSTNMTLTLNPKQELQNTCRSLLNSLQSISETSKTLDNVVLNSKNSNNVKKGRNHFEHGKRALQGLIQSDDWKIALFNFQALLNENQNLSQSPSKKQKLDVPNTR
ncbi:sugar transporter [Gigaspora margarita]|uniref:Sugar transporter n=1 Tax=Gigaspora margarita TaxID=4874 RepID=A0A8H3X1P0_GIGMA|nr:sugar transporter [Gigaspora margarita]